MPLTTLREPPSLDSFTPLSEHQSQTPSTFFNSKPILHYHAGAAHVIGFKNQIQQLPVFVSSEATENGQEALDEQVVEEVAIFVTSENLTLFNTTNSVGVSIPYPAISLHAIQRLQDPATSTETQGLYMQLELIDPNEANDREETDIVEITVILAATSDGASAPVQALFDAVSNCSNLHPDPTNEGDEEMDDDGNDSRIVFEGNVGYEGISGLPGVQQGATDGGLPPPFPGSGGWITAENVSEYFDADGNWIGGGEVEVLGEGAGRVRLRDEVDEEEKVNGHDNRETDEAKRPRTE